MLSGRISTYSVRLAQAQQTHRAGSHARGCHSTDGHAFWCLSFRHMVAVSHTTTVGDAVVAFSDAAA